MTRTPLLRPSTINAQGTHPAKVKRSQRTGHGDLAGQRPAARRTAIVGAILGAMMSLRYVAVLPILAAHGLVPGPAGFDPADLVAAAAARGWHATAQRTGVRAGQQAAHRWRASVFSFDGGKAPLGVGVRGTNGSGATEAEALALALASMLRRHEGGDSGGRTTPRGCPVPPPTEGDPVRIRGQRLHDARIGKGMTIRDLAERSRIDPETIARLETEQEEVPFATVRKLADALGVAVEDLVFWGDEG